MASFPIRKSGERRARGERGEKEGSKKEKERGRQERGEERTRGCDEEGTSLKEGQGKGATSAMRMKMEGLETVKRCYEWRDEQK